MSFVKSGHIQRREHAWVCAGLQPRMLLRKEETKGGNEGRLIKKERKRLNKTNGHTRQTGPISG